MRIDLVSEHASPLAAIGDAEAGGQNVHVATLARVLACRGAQVRVHTRRDDPDIPRTVALAPGVEVVHIDAGPAGPVHRDDLWPHMDEFARNLTAEWRLDRPDVVHAHFWMSGWASVTAATPLQIPVALTFHALGEVKRRQQGAKDTSPDDRIDVERRLLTDVDLVIATTRTEAARHRALGCPDANVVAIPCGVDLDTFTPTTTRAHDGRLRVGVVSRLVERKGIGNVIEAVAALRGVDLVVAGGPPCDAVDHDLTVRRYRDLAASAGIEERVRFVGAVPHPQVPTLLGTVDVVACCPWYEPFGMVALEAMACGRPVVGTRVGGLAETIAHRRTGLLVDPRRPEQITGALSLLQHAPRLRASLGTAARFRAMEYGWNRIGLATDEALGALVSRHAPARVATP